jgi:drug/metabolite transporter (DMT)-like permease
MRLGNSSSVFFSYLILNEKVSIFDIYGLISTMLGVILILKPVFIFGDITTSGEDELIGIVYATICAFMISFGIVLTKKLVNTFDEIYIIFTMGFIGCFVGVTASEVLDVNISVPFIKSLQIIITIFIEFLGLVFMYKALSYEPIVKLAPFYNSKILFSIIFIYFLGGYLDIYDIVGVSIIILTYIYIAYEKIYSDSSK